MIHRIERVIVHPEDAPEQVRSRRAQCCDLTKFLFFSKATKGSIVEEVPLKLAPLLKPLRSPRILTFALLLAATTSGAEALIYCERAAEYPPVADPVVARRIEERLQAIPAMKNHQLRKIDGQFAIAWQDEEECRKHFRCHHLLLDIRNDEARVVFTFQGTGTIWVLGSALNTLSDALDDDYSMKAFETDDFNYVVARLPRFLGPIGVGALPSDDKVMKACAYRKHQG